ncbi:MAG: Ig-like domain-containing protein [Ramlibacter sp.]|nr:Ig-like domain-containing protein [Ramlibacter sp.]
MEPWLVKVRPLSVVLSMYVLVGCGGGSSSPPPLAIASISPGANATGVSTTAAVDILFAEAIQPTSLTGDSAVLRGPGGLISSTISLTVPTVGTGASVLRLTPNQPLAKLSRYDLTLSSEITGVSGAKFPGSTNSFTTADGTWQTAQPLATVTPTGTNPVLAMNASGKALAVWQEQGQAATAWASIFDKSVGAWSIPAQVAGNATTIQGLRVGMDKAGNALTVWIAGLDSAPGTSYLWSNSYNAGTGLWRVPTPIQPVVPWLNDGPLECLVDGNGNAMVLWEQPESQTVALWSARYSAATNHWEQSVKVGTATGQTSRFVAAMDLGGNVHAIWVGLGSLPLDRVVTARAFSASTGQWGTPTAINRPSLSVADFPRVGFDANGNARAIWSETLNQEGVLWTNQFDATTSRWGTATAVPMDSSVPLGLIVSQLGVDDAGNALVVWALSSAAENRVDLWVNRYMVASGRWDGAKKLATLGTTFPQFSRIAIDKAGNAIAAWRESPRGSPSSSVVRASRYRANANTWADPEIVGTGGSPGVTANAPQIDVDGYGDALVIWEVKDTTQDTLRQNRFK